jgi:hypothetical protein
MGNTFGRKFERWVLEAYSAIVLILLICAMSVFGTAAAVAKLLLLGSDLKIEKGM